jgi:outer membrane protein OmpA-like peptidoglycan-associated protein
MENKANFSVWGNSIMIRSAVAVVGLLASVAMPVAAQAASPTVSSYLCQFANRCDDSAAEVSDEETIEAPQTKGFRLARSTNSGTASTTPAPAQQRAAPRQEQARNVGTTRPRAAERVRTSAPVAGASANLVISFELNSAQLTAEGRRNASVFAQALGTSELRGKRFLIAGHTDALGDTAANLDLSKRRAQAVADLLASQGVDRSRLEVEGYGESRPLAGRSATDPANRRVEAILR